MSIQSSNKAVNQIERDLDRLAFQFFKMFSRTEYALKASGFNKGNGQADADWEKFAAVVLPLVESPQTSELATAIDYILKHPPKKQMIKDGQLVWEDCKPSAQSEADLLLLYVRRVRNNLFHGGKFNGNWFAPERNEKLLRCSLIVLAETREYVADVKDAYDH